MALRVQGLVRWAAVLAALAAPGCFPPDDGRAPPLERIYFPVGIAVNPARTRMYVANSDFDLQYNAGSLQVYDLTTLRGVIPTYCERDSDCGAGGRVCDAPGAGLGTDPPSHWCVDPTDPKPCGSFGEKTAAERHLSPGRCRFVDPESPPAGTRPLLVEQVEIGAFVTDVAYRARPESAPAGPEGRLFLPVRGDDTLHWADVDASGGAELDCGQGSDHACDGNHRRGDDPSEENTRGGRLPPEPFGVAVDECGEAIVTTHQSDGSLGLFVNAWDGGASGGPRLEHVLGGLPTGALGVAAVPVARAVRDTTKCDDPRVRIQEGFLVSFRTAAEVRLVRYFDESIDLARTDGGVGTQGSPARRFLEASHPIPLTTNSEGFDSRGIAVDASRRQACEAQYCVGVDPLPQECMDCANRGVDVYVANRTPGSLIVGATQPAPGALPPSDLPRFFDALPVSFGASRVVIGNVRDREGKRVSRVFVLCFDSRQIFVYDPAARRFETVIHTGRGPHALAIDDGADDPEGRAYGYIGHFTDSYLGVVDLNQGHATYGETVLTIGEPTPPRASK